MKADLKNYQGVCTKNESDVFIQFEFGKSLINNWKTYELAVDTTKYSNIKKRIRPFSDYPCFGDTPLFSKKAYLVLKELLESEGEFLKAVLNNVEYYMYNSFNRFNEIINFEKSDFDCDKKDLYSLSQIKIIHINEDLFVNKNLIYIPKFSQNFVSERVVDIITKENFTGFMFEKIWE